MPLFEFICKKCNKKFENLVLNDKDLDIQCPACGAKEVEKQFSSFSSGAGISKCASSDICRPKSKHKCSGGCCH